MLQGKTFRLLLIILFLVTASAQSSVVTLGQAALMSLDYHHYADSLNATVMDKRLSADGVEFDILFPGNTGSDSQMFYGSSVYGGAGTLVWGDLSDYDLFQLDVQLLQVQGYTAQEAEPFELWFSPMVDDGTHPKAFQGQLLSTAAGQSAATALMDISLLSVGEFNKGDLIFEIGYEIHMDDPTVWPSDGVTITLLLSPTAGATQIAPEPTSVSLFLLGALRLFAKRKKHQ